MVSKKIALITAAILSCPIHSMAQQKETNTSMVEHKAGVVTYYPAKMGFSPNDNLGAVFNSITRYCNIGSYTLMVNGEDYLQNDDAFYSRTLVADIERIEIITDQSLMGANIGTNGYINVVLRDREEGTHGLVGFEMDTKKNHTPIASISHKKDKWTVWGSFVGNINKGESETQDESYSQSKSAKSTLNSTTFGDYKNKYKSFSVGTNYKDAKNSITIELNGRWNSGHSNSTVNYCDIYESNNSYTDSKFSLTTTLNSERNVPIKNHIYDASINWKHILNEKLSFNLNASEIISKDTQDGFVTIEQYQTSATGDKSGNNTTYPYINNNDGTLTAFNLYANYKPTTDFGIKIGVLGKMQHQEEDIDIIERYTTKSNDTKITPYVLAQYSLGQLRFSVGERFRFNRIHHEYSNLLFRATASPLATFNADMDTTLTYNTAITTASVAWSPSTNHALMVSYTHQNNDEYAFRIEQAKTLAGLNYLYMEAFPTENNLNVFDLSYSYTSNHFNAGINAKYIKEKREETYKKSNTSLDISTYFVSASASYTHGIFNLAGDIEYYKSKNEYKTNNTLGDKRARENDYGNFWTLRLTPMVSLPNDINVSASFALLSHKLNEVFTEQPESMTSEWLTLRASKSWKDFDFYVKWDKSFGKQVVSASSSHDKDDYNNSFSMDRSYISKHQSSVTFGGCWRF